MKCSIITCQYAYNYGAVLQAYALCRYMNEQGVETKVIDYRPSYRLGGSKSKNPAKLFIRFLIRIPDHIRGARVFDDFLKRRIPLTKAYGSCEELRIDPPESDLYIAGSDQIWNFDLPNGWDPAFYLDFTGESACRIAYAASLSCNELGEKVRDFLRENLQNFDRISVRESTGQSLLHSCGIDHAVTAADPVYLLTDQEWRSMEKAPGRKIGRKYILVMAFNRQGEVFRTGKRLALENGYDVYSVNTYCEDVLRHTDHYFWNCMPEEFLWLVDHAECVVTNSFHGLSFSLIFNRPVLLFEKNDTGNSRMRDLLTYLEIEDQVLVKKGDLASENMSGPGSTRESDPVSGKRNDSTPVEKRNLIRIPVLPYERINGRIARFREESMQYLETFIDLAQRSRDMDKASSNFRIGKVSEAIDLSDF